MKGVGLPLALWLWPAQALEKPHNVGRRVLKLATDCCMSESENCVSFSRSGFVMAFCHHEPCSARLAL